MTILTAVKSALKKPCSRPDQIVMGTTRSWFLFLRCLNVAINSWTPESSSLSSFLSSSPNLVRGSTKMVMTAALRQKYLTYLCIFCAVGFHFFDIHRKILFLVCKLNQVLRYVLTCRVCNYDYIRRCSALWYNIRMYVCAFYFNTHIYI